MAKRKAAASGVGIIDTKVVPIGKLNPAPYNPRKDLQPGDPEYEKIARSIDEFGLVDPLIWNAKTGNLVGGHQRLKILKARGAKRVTVSVVELSHERERQLNLALNKVVGGWDDLALLELLTEIREHDPDGFDLTGFEPGDIDLLMAETGGEVTNDGKTEADAMLTLPAPDEIVSRVGEVYELGPHRLICGDATDPAVVSRLLDGEEPFLMVTDPPYGVSYDAEWRLKAGLNKDHQIRAEGRVENDDELDWTPAYRLFPGRVAYVWHAGRHAGAVSGHLAGAGFEVRTQIVWRKTSLVVGRGHYHWQHEPCFYAVRPGGAARWRGGRKQSTVWDVPNMHRTQGSVDDGKTNHSTQKPVECMARPMRNHGGRGDLVYDPFVGSGTSIIAAERYGRRCFGVELSPAYCDMIRQRYAEFVGGEGAEWR